MEIGRMENTEKVAFKWDFGTSQFDFGRMFRAIGMQLVGKEYKVGPCYYVTMGEKDERQSFETLKEIILKDLERDWAKYLESVK